MSSRSFKILPLIALYSAVILTVGCQNSGEENSESKTPTPGSYKSLDINKDGVLDEDDAEAIVNALTGSAQCPTQINCDFNNNGTLDAGDPTAYILMQNKFYALDLNGDKVLNNSDLELLTRVTINLESCPDSKTCDFNANNAIDAGDVVAYQIDKANFLKEAANQSKSFARLDLNSDGVLDSVDSTLLVQVLIDVLPCPTTKNCDFNNNGKLDAADPIAHSLEVSEFIALDLNGDNNIDTLDSSIINQVLINTAVCPATKNCDFNDSSTIDAGDPIAHALRREALFRLADGVRDMHWLLDINSDGVLDSNDSAQLSLILIGSATCPSSKNCDFNDSSSLDAGDAVAWELKRQTFISLDLNDDKTLDSVDSDIAVNVLIGNISCPAGKDCDFNDSGVLDSGDPVALVLQIEEFVRR